MDTNVLQLCQTANLTCLAEVASKTQS